MKNKLNIELLDKLDLDNLERIKNEAEMNLEEISKSEEIITNKSNSLFQILIVVFSTLVGYLISEFSTFCLNSILIQICIIFSLFIAYALFLLIKIIYPIKIKLKGASPQNLIQDFIFSSKSDEQNTINFFKNRIYSLNLAINNNIESLNNRVNLFYKANKAILYGLLLVILYSLIYFFVVPS